MKLREFRTSTEHYFLNENNQRHGKAMSWYISGKRYDEKSYDHDDLHGEYICWWDNGNVARHGLYDHGKLHGEFKAWAFTGELTHRQFYNKGINITKQASQYADDYLIFALAVGVPRLPK